MGAGRRIDRQSLLLTSARLRKRTVAEPLPGSPGEVGLPSDSACLSQPTHWFALNRSPGEDDRNLVDPASSHMFVSKIKPCMSQYKSLHVETANGSLKQF